MDASEHAFLAEYASRTFALHLDADALARLTGYLDLLEVWNRRLRLTGERDRESLVRRHVADALACVPLIPEGGSFLDVGTGAGFPGAVIACVRPDLHVTLLDARERPVTFLREVIRTLPLPGVRAVVRRAEDARRDPEQAGRQQVVSSRAIRLDRFLPLVPPLLAPGGIAVSMQTPATDLAIAQAVATPCGLEVVELRDYELPDGDERRLVVVRPS